MVDRSDLDDARRRSGGRLQLRVAPFDYAGGGPAQAKLDLRGLGLGRDRKDAADRMPALRVRGGTGRREIIADWLVVLVQPNDGGAEVAGAHLDVVRAVARREL